MGYCSVLLSAGAEVTVVLHTCTDYYRPTSGASLCDMLSAVDPRQLHLWSPNETGPFVQPAYIRGDSQGVYYGGCADFWGNESERSADDRKYISFCELMNALPMIVPPASKC